MNAEQLALLVKTEWKLSYVTPLYQFRHTQLKSYSRQLSAFIAAEKQQGLAVEVEGSQNSFRVSFSVVHGMAGTDDDAESVLIQVRGRQVRVLRQMKTLQAHSATFNIRKAERMFNAPHIHVHPSLEP